MICSPNRGSGVTSNLTADMQWVLVKLLGCTSHLFNYVVHTLQQHGINSMAPGKFEWNFKYLILQIILVIYGWGISCQLALRWMSINLTDKSTLVKVMAWCLQIGFKFLQKQTSHQEKKCNSEVLYEKEY